MKTEITTIIKHTAGLLLLVVFSLVTISYARRDFELPFFVRGEDTSYLDNNFDDFTEPEPTLGTVPETTTEIGNLSDVIDLSALAEENNSGDRVQHTTEEFEIWNENLANAGYKVSDGMYDIVTDKAKVKWKTELEAVRAENLLIDAENAQITLDNEKRSEKNKKPLLQHRRLPQYFEYKFVKLNLDYASIPKSLNYTDQNTAYLMVEPFMDYFYMKTTTKKILCTAEGKPVIGDISMTGMTLLMARDTANKTVFQKEDKYYTYDADFNSFVETQYEPIIGDRGIRFMYPSYYGGYGLGKYDRSFVKEARTKWGYVDAYTGEEVVSNKYDIAYNFSEGCGIAVVKDDSIGNSLVIVDEAGRENVSGYSVCETNEEKNLGFFYYDHGLTRAIYMDFDPIAGTMVEGSALIDRQGKRFSIPKDYNLKAYSNGMILLEKAGKYGFMNYMGEWVINPVFNYATPFYEGVAVIGIEDGKKALIDTYGNLLTKFHYNYISKCTGGIIAFFNKEEGWLVVNKVAREIKE